MGSNRILAERDIQDCGNGWCGDPGNCEGHHLKFNYNSVVDYSTLELDGFHITGPDNIIEALVDLAYQAIHKSKELEANE